jgi:hypothetical protein
MTQRGIVIVTRIQENCLLFYPEPEMSIRSSMVRLYSNSRFLTALEKNDDNLDELMQEVRNVYGRNITNLQVLEVMCKLTPHNFFPNRLLDPKVVEDIEKVKICAVGGEAGVEVKVSDDRLCTRMGAKCEVLCDDAWWKATVVVREDRRIVVLYEGVGNHREDLPDDSWSDRIRPRGFKRPREVKQKNKLF